MSEATTTSNRPAGDSVTGVVLRLLAASNGRLADVFSTFGSPDGLTDAAQITSGKWSSHSRGRSPQLFADPGMPESAMLLLPPPRSAAERLTDNTLDLGSIESTLGSSE